jgi:hypothetical protein
MNGWVDNCFLRLHENFFNVLPRLCKTEWVQIAIAADSFAAAVDLIPRRNFTVFLTDLTQRQKVAEETPFILLCPSFFP